MRATIITVLRDAGHEVIAIGVDELTARAREAGAKGFLVKPFQPPDLLAAVEEVLQHED